MYISYYEKREYLRHRLAKSRARAITVKQAREIAAVEVKIESTSISDDEDDERVGAALAGMGLNDP